MERIPSKTGRILYLSSDGQRQWGDEDWRVTRSDDGLRTLAVRCELEADGLHIVRDIVQSVDRAYHPHDASVRLTVDRVFHGSAWFTFDDQVAQCEARTVRDGRISQSLPIDRGIRGFGTHALQSDAWCLARFDFSRGPGRQRFIRNLMSSTHHLGATGPFFMTTDSSLDYVGDETVEVAAGRFDCFRFRFVETSNGHPPYDLWVTRDGDFTYVLGIAGGYMDARFELVELRDV